MRYYFYTIVRDEDDTIADEGTIEAADIVAALLFAEGVNCANWIDCRVSEVRECL